MSAAVVLMAYGSPERLDDVPAYYSDIRGGRTVSDQRVRQAVRARIHRTGYRHTLRLQSPPAAILNRGEEARFDHEEMAHRSRS